MFIAFIKASDFGTVYWAISKASVDICTCTCMGTLVCATGGLLMKQGVLIIEVSS